MAIEFWKYHGLGNDYAVFVDGALGEPPDPALVRRICDRHHGLGADGVLLDVSPSGAGSGSGGAPRPGGAPRAAVRIFNPDGSEAEKSGNGLRIFARYLRDQGRAPAGAGEWFAVATPGGEVECAVAGDGRRVAVEMGRASFDAAAVPVIGAAGEVLGRWLEVAGQELEYSAVTVGNPHCVLVREEARAEDARTLGPLLERHPAFPNRTNVQLAQVLGVHCIRIEIWERGAGYTLASGSSSCAAAAVCCRLGLVRSPVTVEMPGGALSVVVRGDDSLRMEGPVTAVARGVLSEECLVERGLA